MRRFPLAVAIICALPVVLFGTTFALLKFFAVAEPQTTALQVAQFGALPTTLLPFLKQYLEREEGRTNLAAGKGTAIYDMRGFQIAWPRMVMYGTAVLFGVTQALGGITGGVLAELEIPFSRPALILLLMFTILTAYFVGRWVGTRCSRHGVVTILLIALLTAIGAVTIDVLTVPDEDYKELFRNERADFLPILVRITGTTFTMSMSALIGYWRGHKQRLSKYLNYLLGILPAETRNTVVGLVFDEAQRVANQTSVAPM